MKINSPISLKINKMWKNGWNSSKYSLIQHLLPKYELVFLLNLKVLLETRVKSSLRFPPNPDTKAICQIESETSSNKEYYIDFGYSRKLSDIAKPHRIDFFPSHFLPKYCIDRN